MKTILIDRARGVSLLLGVGLTNVSLGQAVVIYGDLSAPTISSPGPPLFMSSTIVFGVQDDNSGQTATVNGTFSVTDIVDGFDPQAAGHTVGMGIFVTDSAGGILGTALTTLGIAPTEGMTEDYDFTGFTANLTGYIGTDDITVEVFFGEVSGGGFTPLFWADTSSGTYANGVPDPAQACITSVPEPSSIVLLGAGMLSLSLRRKGRK